MEQSGLLARVSCARGAVTISHVLVEQVLEVLARFLTVVVQFPLPVVRFLALRAQCLVLEERSLFLDLLFLDRKFSVVARFLPFLER